MLTKDIINIGNNIILVSSEPVKINKFRPRLSTKPKQLIENKVIMLTEPQYKEKPKEVQTNKIITDFRFLTGRTLNKDILATNGELIAKKDSIITKEIVNLASMYGKLVEIARYSNKKM